MLRRVESLIPGEYLTPQVGGGTELAMIRPYRPGDDVRYMDWNVTARMREPHVRVHVGERAMTAWLLLDVSSSMTFGTADRRKADVAEGVALAIGHVSTRRGNRLGVVAIGAGEPRILRPRQGRLGLLALLSQLRADPEEDGAGATMLGTAVQRTAALARNRGLVVVVSDFRGDMDWEGPLRTLRARHGVLAVEVRDPRELELPPVGDLWLTDPETGRQLHVNTNKRRVRKRFAKAAAEEREEVAAALRRAGADHLVLSTDGDWLRSLAGHLQALRAADARRAGEGGVSFREPSVLIGLLLLPLAAMAYLVMQRRRRAEAARFGNPALLPGLATARPGWRRHLPPLLLLVALGALVIALARPQRSVAAPQRQATVMMVTDVSGSMRATDVEPDRLSAAVEAGHALADKLPEELRLGLVSFSDYAEQTVAPTTDREPVEQALDRLVADGGTAMGDALRRGIEAARTPVANANGSGTRRLPAVIVLLSDGKNTSGNTRPLDVARQAKALKIPIYAIALGTPSGEIELTDPFSGTTQTIAVPPDPETLRAIARTTGGRFFETAKAAELESIYANLGTRLSSKQEKREVTVAFAGGGLVLLLVGGGLSLAWFGRLP